MKPNRKVLNSHEVIVIVYSSCRWLKMAYDSTMYAEELMEESGKQETSGYAWKLPITISEMMIFIGIRIKMVIEPCPGCRWTVYLDESHCVKWTKRMKKTRAAQINVVWHCTKNEDLALSNDVLCKVCSLLNAVKSLFPKHLDVGNELALD